MNDFGVMQYASGGMDAQRSALDVLARNVALVQTADRAHPVHPLVPQFAVAGDDGDDFAASLASIGAPAPDDDADASAADDGTDGSEAVAYDVASPAGDATSGVPGASFAAFEPGGLDAVDDGDPLPGAVRYAGARPSARGVSGVDAVGEMVAVLDAQRSFEADASTFDTGKRLIDKTLSVEQI